MKIISTAVTRPRISSGVASCVSVARMITLIMSLAPSRKSAISEMVRLRDSPKAMVAVPKIATPQRVRVSSGVQSGLLIRKVPPTYPPLARQARIQGTVILQAQISKTGDIENLQLISGHPMLAPAAIEAVKQWKYKPYLLNGEPVEVETTVQVNFSLAGS